MIKPVSFFVPLQNDHDTESEEEYFSLPHVKTPVTPQYPHTCTSSPVTLNETQVPDFSISVPDTPLVKKTKMENFDIKCSTFSGYPQDNAKRFLSEFESYALLHGLENDDPRRIAAFHLHLKGPALTWYNSLSQTAKQKWSRISVLFDEKYVNFNVHSATVIMESELFQSMTLSQGQSLEDFYSHLVEKAQILQKPEHEIVSKFISALPEKMAFFVRAGQPRDIQSALTSAKIAEASGYRKYPDSVNALRNIRDTDLFRDGTCSPKAMPPFDNSQSGESLVSLQQKVETLTDMVKQTQGVSPKQNCSKSDIDELKQKIQSLEKLVRDMSLHKGSTDLPKTEFKSNDANSRPRYRPKTCNKCHGHDHFQRVCNWDGKEQSQPDKQCQLCQQYGHIAVRCTSLNKPYQGNTQTPGDGHSRPG